MRKGHIPFKNLGSELAKLRNDLHESLAEVSGAVEIDGELLGRYEAGEIRPSEEILQLLISHFEVRDEQADRLWELAGFNQTKSSSIDGNNDHLVQQPAIMLLPVDARIVYTDVVHVTVNGYGVVMNFLQNNGPNNSPLPVSRVGMSMEHAKSVIEVLQKTIEQANYPKTPKLLVDPKTSNKKKNKS